MMSVGQGRRHAAWIACWIGLASTAIGQPAGVDFQRASGLQDRFRDKVTRTRIEPRWLSGTRFWYPANLGQGRREYVFVDAEIGSRRLAFDHERVATALADAAEDGAPAADRLVIEKLSFDDDGGLAALSLPDGPWLGWDDAAGTLTPLEGADQPRARRPFPWRPGRMPRFGDRPRRISPDGRWEVVLRDGALVLRDRRPEGDERDEDDEGEPSDDAAPTEFEKAPAPDGSDYFAESVYWAPDSSRFVAMQVSPGDGRVIHLVESSPKEQLQGKLHEKKYAKPGDKIEQRRPRLFPVGGAAEIPVDNALFDNPWAIQRTRWDKDSSRFTFVYNQRGHQALRLIAVDGATGAARAIIDERSETFIEYSRKQFIYFLDDTREVVWMSERDGWNHLYLIDADTGRVKRQLTRGPWVVRGVDHVDPERREVLFQCGGIYGEQDPYYLHHCTVNLDTGAVTRLTAGDGSHSVRFSPDRRFLIDSYSRVDMPPVTELRRAAGGSLVCGLERADSTRLAAAGWRPPERFVAKGRDGKTDIYGVIFRPTDFDPAQSYPVIEEHYAGPHSAFVPKEFRPVHRGQEMAELGFIVVRMDGMGTSQRSKAFHDVACKNLVDAGLPDRIAWIKAAARHEPAMDLDRVGIRGTSAGGQTAMAALLWHGDFYKVAVSNCGCHDNRVDKIWWNELWMGWPIGPHYEEQSNVTNAHRLKGDLFLIVGEMDTNVDPISTMQVVDALIKADKDFEMLVVPGGGHGAGAYARKRTWDFFVRKLHGPVSPRP